MGGESDPKGEYMTVPLIKGGRHEEAPLQLTKRPAR